jgi:hypothetical protein
MRNIYFYISLALVFLALILSVTQSRQADAGGRSGSGAGPSSVSRMSSQSEAGRKILEVDDPMGDDMDRLLNSVEELTEGDTE